LIDIEQYIPLVKSLASKLYQKYKHRYEHEYEDLVQVGYIGLIKAVREFDENKGTKFITFAWDCIRYEILQYVINDRWFLARNRNERAYSAQIISSLDICVGKDKEVPKSELISYRDTIPDLDLQIAIENLPKKLEKIIRLKYFYGYRQREIGNMMGLNQVAISRGERKALKMLKEALRDEHICIA